LKALTVHLPRERLRYTVENLTVDGRYTGGDSKRPLPRPQVRNITNWWNVLGIQEEATLKTIYVKSKCRDC